MTWITGYKLNSMDPLEEWYADIEEFYWTYINSSVCKFWTHCRAPTEESNNLDETKSDDKISIENHRSSLNNYYLHSKAIIKLQNERKIENDKFSNENNDLRNKIKKITEERLDICFWDKEYQIYID